jgi:hypothetical protein
VGGKYKPNQLRGGGRLASISRMGWRRGQDKTRGGWESVFDGGFQDIDFPRCTIMFQVLDVPRCTKIIQDLKDSKMLSSKRYQDSTPIQTYQKHPKRFQDKKKYPPTPSRRRSCGTPGTRSPASKHPPSSHQAQPASHSVSQPASPASQPAPLASPASQPASQPAQPSQPSPAQPASQPSPHCFCCYLHGF